jgi:hypothetical protein
MDEYSRRDENHHRQPDAVVALFGVGSGGYWGEGALQSVLDEPE